MDTQVWRVIKSNRAVVSYIHKAHSEALESYFKTFVHKEFMLQHAEGLASHSVWNAHQEEEAKVMTTVREFSVNKVPKGSNVITSHVTYKVKANDDGSLKLKARIAHHGNKDRDRERLKTDSSHCPPTGIRILTSIATIMHWSLAKIDFTSAFLQTGEAKRDAYVIQPRECRKDLIIGF